MDPMLYVIAFDAMQRQLDENARLRLGRARADALDRPEPWWRRARATLRVRRLALPAVVPAVDLAPGPGCCPA